MKEERKVEYKPEGSYFRDQKFSNMKRMLYGYSSVTFGQKQEDTRSPSLKGLGSVL